MRKSSSTPWKTRRPTLLAVAGGGEIVILTEQEFGSTAEFVGILAAAIILLVAFGSVVAMGLPIVTALLGLLIGLLGIGVVANFMNVATFAPIFASMIGIGVGIDYALFIVTRFREGLHGGMTPQEAAGRAVDTAGRAVIFAGAVVVISMLGLSIIGVEFVTSLGVSAAFVVAAAVAGRPLVSAGLPGAHRQAHRQMERAPPAHVQRSQQPHFGRRLSRPNSGASRPLRPGRCRLPDLPRSADPGYGSWLPRCRRQPRGFHVPPGV